MLSEGLRREAWGIYNAQRQINGKPTLKDGEKEAT